VPGNKWRLIVSVGLALGLLIFMGQTVWTAGVIIRTDAQLKQAGKWLRGTVILVDPGHGGDDPGAVVGETLEKGIVLSIAKALKQELEAQGAKVVLTRDSDVSLGGPMREELGRRVALVNEHKANLFVSIHANKDRCNCWGAQTFYQKSGMPAGQQLAEALQNQLKRLTDTTRSALPANYFVLRTSPVPAAMVEVGFLTNAKERGLLQDVAYQTRLAKAVTLGLADFIRSQVPEAKAEGLIGR
jgi:N-acetylmuramoyl-L-alanine amidase